MTATIPTRVHHVPIYKQKSKEVVRKSRAGVSYTHYVPFIEGPKLVFRPNRAQRRAQDKLDRRKSKPARIKKPTQKGF